MYRSAWKVWFSLNSQIEYSNFDYENDEISQCLTTLYE